MSILALGILIFVGFSLFSLLPVGLLPLVFALVAFPVGDADAIIVLGKSAFLFTLLKGSLESGKIGVNLLSDECVRIWATIAVSDSATLRTECRKAK